MVQAEKLTRHAESRPTAYSLRRQSTPTVFAEIEKRHGQQLALGGEKERCFSFGPSKPSFGPSKLSFGGSKPLFGGSKRRLCRARVRFDAVLGGANYLLLDATSQRKS